MFIFDRLYGKLTFPPLIQKVLDCPGLLRLREVRMANIPFYSFPSFAATTRYEHSLGVCHLAGVFANNVGLTQKDKYEVMLAALYHDVATPPFAHAVEEVLANLYGFNHEDKLRQLIIGKSEDLGKHRAQLFLGQSLKLHRVCQTKEARNMGIDIFRVANIAAGSPDDPLSDLICSNDIDLDNVDNVFRAATAMGIYRLSKPIPENLAKCFVFDGSRICIDESGISYVEEWQNVRELLYRMIYSSTKDFAQQTMLKHAFQNLAQSSTDFKLLESDWCLTDNELIHQRLLQESAPAEIVKRMRLGDAYTCLAFLSVEGLDCITTIMSKLEQIEKIAMECFHDYIGRKKAQGGRTRKSKYTDRVPEIVANAYPDKRHRAIKRPISFMGQERYLEEKVDLLSKVFLGIFTPHHSKWDVLARKVFIKELRVAFHKFNVNDAHNTIEQWSSKDGGRAE